MSEERIISPNEPARVPAMKRASWGAIIAGVVVILMIQMILWLLGLSIGLAAASPQDGNWQGLGIGAIIWLVISTIIALFIGGWATGRLAGVPRRIDGALHGIVAWGTSTILALYLVSSAVGAVFGGAMSVLQTAARKAPMQQIVRQAPMTQEQIQQEARSLIQSRPAQGANEQQRQQAQQRLDAAIDRMLPEDTQAQVPQQQRQEVVAILTESTEMNEDEASQKVDQWVNSYRRAEQLQTGARQVAQQAQEAAPEALDISAQAAFWSFLALLIGAAAAALGGLLGAPKDVVTTRGNW
jgi:hypothetical protein